MILDYFWAVFLPQIFSPAFVMVPSKFQSRPRTSPIKVPDPRKTKQSQESKTLAIKGKTFFLVVAM